VDGFTDIGFGQQTAVMISFVGKHMFYLHTFE